MSVFLVFLKISGDSRQYYGCLNGNSPIWGALQLANEPQIRGYLHQCVNSGIFVEHLNTLDFSTLISEACIVYVKFEPIQHVCSLEIMGKV